MHCKTLLAAIFLLITCNAMAQTSDTTFKKEWIDIDTILAKNNLPKTALQKVNALYKKAIANHLEVQVIKCLVYRMSLEDRVYDNKPNNAIIVLQNEINQTNNIAAKSILYCLIANRYQQYYNNNRWKFYNRSKTINFKKEDIETWSADDFGKAINENFLQSIANAAALQKVKLSDYDAIIIKGNARKLRPTLYDVLIHEALDYFKSGDYYLTKPEYAFELKDIHSIQPSKIFVYSAFSHADTASHLLVALQLFQQLEKFHTGDEDQSAWVDVILERIQWAYNNLIHDDKEKVYAATLQNLCAYKTSSAAQACYLLAEIQRGKANTYQPFGDTTHRYANLEALKIIDEALQRFTKKSEGTNNLKNVRHQIIEPSIITETEKVNIPNKPFRALVQYRNAKKLFVRVLKKDKNNPFPNDNTWDYKKYWKKWAALKPITSFQQSLPATKDYQQHSVEIKIDALPVGEYILLCSTEENFIDSTDRLCKQSFTVSNIAYFKNGKDYFVANRETGEPLDKVKVTITKVEWNSKLRINETIIVDKLTTDKNGHFVFTQKDRYGSFSFVFETKNDKLDLNSSEYISYTKDNDEDDEEDLDAEDIKDYEKDNAKVFFFTDRSIYRLGQTVYFKGIAITKDYTTKQSKIVAGKDSVLVYFEDANDKIIDSAYFKTNDYGSFTGKFTIPQNVLTGNFSLKTDDFSNSSIRFKVEEYKRPKFYVEFEKTKGAYRINDSVTVIGTAKAFAGNAVDGAKVKFNVQRNARFIYDWYWRGGTRPNSGSKQITNGEMVTDAEGKFKITFKATADESVDKKTDPLFDFSISADVTDLNGETRSSKTQLTVGYKSLLLNVSVPKIAEANSLKNFFINTKNLSDEKEPAIVQVNIYSIQTPERLIRKSLWQRADQFVMNKETYLNNFPYDDYNDELNENNWAVKQLVHQGSINTKDSTNYQLPTTNLLPPGYYKIEAITKDKDGNSIKDIQYLQLFSRKAAPYPQYNFSYTINNYAPPTQTAQFLSGSSADKIFVVQQTTNNQTTEQKNTKHQTPNKLIPNFKFLNYPKGLHPITYTTNENDRGNTAISEAYILHNRFYTNHYPIEVPWDNKALQVNYTSYRNKTEPGSKETYTVTVQGNKGEKAAAELLTTMYDASLDQFNPHRFTTPNIWNTKYLQNGFGEGQGFGSEEANQNSIGKSERTIEIKYDEIVKSSEQIRMLSARNYRIFKYEEARKIEITKFTPPKIVSDAESVKDSARFTYMLGTEPDGDGVGEVMMMSKGLAGAAAGVSIRTVSISREEATIRIRGLASVSDENSVLVVIDGVVTEKSFKDLDVNSILTIDVLKSAQAQALYGAKGANGVLIVTTKNAARKKQQNPPIQPRKNFNETAFFFPNLYADTAGNYSFSFTIPEALTQWKWLSFAHTKNLAFGSNSAIITTQKTLMVQPNAPRFMREGDNLEFVAKISNLISKELTGQCTLELIDATNGNSVDGWFQNSFPIQYFTAAAGQSAVVKFPMQVPFNFNKPLTWKVVARAPSPMERAGGEVSDGEENTLPILTNRILVTETLPLYLKPNETSKSFTFDKLINNKSESLTNESITVEYTANPIWSVVKSLPYLMEYPYECAEQTFNRFYANALAAQIINKYPRIKEVFTKWLKDSSLISPLKNGTALAPSPLERAGGEALKQILLEETPWVLQAESEEQQQKNIALLFDLVKMSNSTETAINKLQQMQLPSGGFAWFKGGREDRYITNYILTGMGKLQKLGAFSQNDKVTTIITKAIQYVDEQVKEDYNWLIKNKADMTKQQIGTSQIQYLYMKSFFATDTKKSEAYNYYYNQAKQFWNKQNTYHAAMIGLVLHRNNERRFVNVNILPSVTENAIEDTTKGTVYWKDRNTCFWYASPIEHQSMLINFLHEVAQKENMQTVLQTVDAAKTWLILNKQTNNWQTTVATADACYALLNAGSNWLASNQQVQIQLGSTIINSQQPNKQHQTPNPKQETGYLKQRIPADKVKPDMGNIKVTITNKPINQQPTTNNQPSYGSIYWQYFEDLDKITAASSPLSLNKKLFVEKNTAAGKVLQPINQNDELKVGDKVIVRIELRSDREMEYLHLKDMRASGSEPVNVLSGYKWQDGLGYYEATKDASTNFFIDRIQKGTHVFEYPIFITHTGTFSVGIATIQCMYAPEFTSHSEGIKIRVKE